MGPNELGRSDSEDADDDTGLDGSVFLLPPLPPRPRLGVADREPGGVSVGDEVTEPDLT